MRGVFIGLGHFLVQFSGSFYLQFSVFFLEPLHVTLVEVFKFPIDFFTFVSLSWDEFLQLAFSIFIFQFFELSFPPFELLLVSLMDRWDVFQLINSAGVVSQGWSERVEFVEIFL